MCLDNKRFFGVNEATINQWLLSYLYNKIMSIVTPIKASVFSNRFVTVDNLKFFFKSEKTVDAIESIVNLLAILINER